MKYFKDKYKKFDGNHKAEVLLSEVLILWKSFMGDVAELQLTLIVV